MYPTNSVVSKRSRPGRAIAQGRRALSPVFYLGARGHRMGIHHGGWEYPAVIYTLLRTTLLPRLIHDRVIDNRGKEMIMTKLTLISHHLCPYVQRAVIALTEKEVPFERIDVDLASKPDWFMSISPLRKTPVLKVGEAVIFESAVILEYLEDSQPAPLHPTDPLRRAEHRSWIEFGSATLNDVAGFYSAPDEAAFAAKTGALSDKFALLEQRLRSGPYFDGNQFSLVDAVFGPVFRYFDVFDRIGEFGILARKPRVIAWRNALAARPSIHKAVAPDYETRLWSFLHTRKSHISRIMPSACGCRLRQQQ
jgi:glutathione S-transferase